MKLMLSSEKAGLKLNIQKTKTMASSPITSWQINEDIEKRVIAFIFLGSKIIADNFMAAITICSDFGAQKNKV